MQAAQHHVQQCLQPGVSEASSKAPPHSAARASRLLAAQQLRKHLQDGGKLLELQAELATWLGCLPPRANRAGWLLARLKAGQHEDVQSPGQLGSHAAAQGTTDLWNLRPALQFQL